MSHVSLGHFARFPPHVVTTVLKDLTMGELDSLSKTCHLLQNIAVQFMGYKVDLLIERFELAGAVNFLDILHDSSAVISGDAALTVVNPWTFNPTALDIYVAKGEFRRMGSAVHV
ncbi:hypothetical protein H0H93_013251 [Arthromyces matolae]|nr:hypothetical protein H0H93_013251 [Arthromyces matolae]